MSRIGRWLHAGGRIFLSGAPPTPAISRLVVSRLSPRAIARRDRRHSPPGIWTNAPDHDLLGPDQSDILNRDRF
jgi:hypothetical protein